MPHEAFPIVKESRGHDREEVGDKIAATFDLIAEHGGKFVTALEFTEQEYNVSQGGTPSTITYIVADFEKPFSRNDQGDMFKVNDTRDPYQYEDLSG